jgi:hypothetical protein
MLFAKYKIREINSFEKIFFKIKLNQIMHENWVHENKKSRLLQIIQLSIRCFNTCRHLNKQ